MKKRTILIIDDQLEDMKSLSIQLRRLGLKVYFASTKQQALSFLSDSCFDFLLCDLHLETTPGEQRPDGLSVISEALIHQPSITVIATSSDPRKEIWEEAMNLGAHHFARKPILSGDELLICLDLARQRKCLIDERRNKEAGKRLNRWSEFTSKYPYQIVVSERDLRVARSIAKSKSASIVVLGETGTGKEEIAKLIHRFRVEIEGFIPFIAVNCAVISGSLAESLLFGHSKGSFTGAEKTTNGYIGEADGGILFLDEIQTLDISTQQKLLRVLNDGTYHRMGETKVCHSQFQLIAASTKNLDDEVEANRFLLDIRMRMVGIDILLPPLRERLHDLPALVAIYFDRKNILIDHATFISLLEKLRRYYWPGNIRQLFKVLDTWMLICDFEGSPFDLSLFPDFRAMYNQVGGEKKPAKESSQYDFLTPFSEDRPLDESVARYEREIIKEALNRHKSIGDACVALNVSRSTFDFKRKKYDL